ncbi:unnamed protein product [Rhizoctonia solani]|uniref:Uncharacterized protein n=1 Tax=Rhizoctonia solani TaxID=456999 RepID=A0A8H3CDH5_9AGAM|nr:unnamed protein product [Rhizoctonia solani]
MKLSFAALFALALSPCLVSASAIPSYQNTTLPEGKLVARAEKTEKFDSYSAASIASYKWVNQGKTKVVPKNLVLYVSRLKASPAYNKVVGVGLKTAAGSITPRPHRHG